VPFITSSDILRDLLLRIGKVIRGVKAKTGKNGDLPSKIGRNQHPGMNRLNLPVLKILQIVPTDQNHRAKENTSPVDRCMRRDN
jgi:hypothetical protein